MLSGFVCRPIGWPSTKNQHHVSLNWHLDQQTQTFAKKEKKTPTHSFFIIHLPLWTVRLKHTSKCRRALFFILFYFCLFFYMQFTTSRVLPVEPRTELYSRMHTKHTAHSAAPRLLLVTQCFLTPCLEWSTEQLINQCWEVSHPSKHMADCLWNILKATRSIQQPLKAHGAISL